MGKKRIVRRPGFFGTENLYDERGQLIGKSRPGLLSGTRIYTDKYGRPMGVSRPGFFGTEVFTDEKKNTVFSHPGMWGNVLRRNGKTIGRSHPGFFDSMYFEFDDD